MLTDVSVLDAIPSPMAFSSLTYLSLFGVLGLKPYINTPCLVTFHDGGSSPPESFSSPEAYQMDFTLYFETERPLQIPLFFGER